MNEKLKALSLGDLDIIIRRYNNSVQSANSWLSQVSNYNHNITAPNSGLIAEIPISQEDITLVITRRDSEQAKLDILLAELDTRINALFETQPVPLVISQELTKDLKHWQKILGFIPEKIYHTDDHNNCLHCNSTARKHINSPPWTSIEQCVTCGYYTYIIHQDKMGTVALDSVAVDRRFSTLMASKSSTET